MYLSSSRVALMSIKPDFKELCFIFRVTRFPVFKPFLHTDVGSECIGASQHPRCRDRGAVLEVIRHRSSALCGAAAAQPPPCSGSLWLWWHKDTFRPFDKSQAWLLLQTQTKQNRETAEERGLGFVKVGTWDLARKGNPNLHFFLN